jgi:hypothetical protein
VAVPSRNAAREGHVHTLLPDLPVTCHGAGVTRLCCCIATVSDHVEGVGHLVQLISDAVELLLQTSTTGALRAMLERALKLMHLIL